MARERSIPQEAVLETLEEIGPATHHEIAAAMLSSEARCERCGAEPAALSEIKPVVHDILTELQLATDVGLGGDGWVGRNSGGAR